MNNTLLTIVTVSYNAESSISETIESVLSQRFDFFEYLIVDGGSTDATVKIAKSYEPKFADKGIKYTCISEKDNGIYDAMNKAANMASGKWLSYMNAGDTFSNEYILSSVFIEQDINADVIYGDTNMFDGTSVVLQPAKELSTIERCIPFCHQSSFTKIDCVRNYKFNEKYKIAADYDLFLRMFLDGKNFKHVEIPISNFKTDGVSSINEYETYKDMVAVKEALGIIDGSSIIQKLKNFYFKLKLSHF